MTEDAARSRAAPRGFDRGAVALATITIALTIWPIAFNLGAYGEVFYTDVFSFVVAATVGFGIAVLASPYVGLPRWWTLGALAAPALWLALAVVLFDSTAQAASDGVFAVVGLLVVVVSVPTVLKMLMDLFVPDLVALEDHRLVGTAVAVIVLVAAAGYAVGANNDAFLVCADFEVAGAATPSNCSRRGP